MPQFQEYIVDERGDIEVFVQNCKFRVSSSKMSSLSPKFRDLFGKSNDSALNTIELLEDPETFHRICQSAHGFFIPQADISIETLVKLADAVQRYQVPETSRLHAVVNFCFIVQTFKPGTLSRKKLLQLLQVAEALNSSKLRQLLLDVFVHQRHCFETLSQDKSESPAWLLGVFSVQWWLLLLTSLQRLF